MPVRPVPRFLSPAPRATQLIGELARRTLPRMPTPRLPAAARALDARMRTQIPMVRALEVAIVAQDARTLVMAAPLAPNVNDKGCAFGGSLASVMTLAGWALVNLTLAEYAQECDVFVARSETAYRAPVWQDFRACATLTEQAGSERFLATLAARGKARVSVQCTTRETGDDACCATLDAQFVARMRRDKSTPGTHAVDAAQ